MVSRHPLTVSCTTWGSRGNKGLWDVISWILLFCSTPFFFLSNWCFFSPLLLLLLLLLLHPTLRKADPIFPQVVSSSSSKFPSQCFFFFLFFFFVFLFFFIVTCFLSGTVMEGTVGYSWPSPPVTYCLASSLSASEVTGFDQDWPSKMNPLLAQTHP